MIRIKVAIEVSDGNTYSQGTQIERRREITIEKAAYDNDRVWQLTEAIIGAVNTIAEDNTPTP